ncbi:MAG: glycosyltransferase [Coriobacteriales bacterium]|nr:glycosyltransferase [Coriobacteriales bacterium]
MLISFCIPCFNVADYLDHALESILAGCRGREAEVEVILVDDCSTDGRTPQAVDAWQARHPELIRAVHHPCNLGHGGAVNTGLSEAQGEYFKVLDADDWFSPSCLGQALNLLKAERPDVLICDYVYEKPSQQLTRTIGYRKVLPAGRIFNWSEIKSFKPWQNILMHSVIYRRELLSRLHLPEHTFYVDNLFVYLPLPKMEKLYYAPLPLYRYFIGREGQSVQEEVMAGRIDQQLLVTRTMMAALDPLDGSLVPQLGRYLAGYLMMMLVICNVFLIINGRPGLDAERAQLWSELKASAPATYRKLHNSLLGRMARLPSHALIKGGYHLAQRVFPFN